MSCGVLWHSAELLKSNYDTNYEISIRHLAPHAAPDGAQKPPRRTRWAEEQRGRHLNSVQILWLTHPCSLRFRRAVSAVHNEIAASFLRSFFHSFFLSSCMLCNISFLLAIWHNIKIIIRFALLPPSLSLSSSSCSSSSAPFQGRHSSIARGCSHSKALHLRFAAEDHFHFSIWVSATKRSTVIMGIILGCLVQVSDFDELLTFRFSCTITSASNINKAVRWCADPVQEIVEICCQSKSNWMFIVIQRELDVPMGYKGCFKMQLCSIWM